jgi:uncharacterized membrane-anchored protein
MSEATPRRRPDSRPRAARPSTPQPPSRARAAMVKVPEITAFFWITKALTTAMGESTSDFLVHRLAPVIAVGLGGIGLLIALALQFSASKYIAWVYWLAVAMVGIFGTMAADALHVGLGVPYIVSSIFFVLALAAVFVTWYASEKTLSIHSVYTTRRELFYWAAVMATFALGTAVGDLTAVTLHLGYLVAGVMFAALIAVPGIAYWRFGANAVLTFWCAYVLTRPLGASFADWMGVSHARGGLDLGAGKVSIVLALVILGFVRYLTITRRDVPGRLAVAESV